jgi:hypothetical protein
VTAVAEAISGIEIEEAGATEGSTDEQRHDAAATFERWSRVAPYSPASLDTLRTLPRAARLGVYFCASSLVVGSVATAFAPSGEKLPPDEFFSVAASGLLTLASVVPAVLGVILIGKPVMRLDRGRFLLQGWPVLVGLGYAVLWALGLLACFFSLIELPLPLLSHAALGLTLAVTSATPLLLLAATHPLQPEQSTLLAVQHARRHTGEVAEAIVKGLRDVAMLELSSGDRQAVQCRLKGLATLAVMGDGVTARDALDEMGYLTQELVLDRDLAGEALVLLCNIADAREDIRSKAIGEVVSVWIEALERHASPLVTRFAAQKLNHYMYEDSREIERVVGRMLDPLRMSMDHAFDSSLGDYQAMTRRIHVGEATTASPAISSKWLDFLVELGPRGLSELAKACVWIDVNLAKDSELRRRSLEAWGRALMRQTGSSTHRRAIRGHIDVTARLDGGFGALTDVALHTLRAGDGRPPERAAVLSELILHLRKATPLQVEHLTTAVRSAPSADLAECAEPVVTALEHLSVVLQPGQSGDGSASADPELLHRQVGFVSILVALVRATSAHDHSRAQLWRLLALAARCARRSQPRLLPESAAGLRRRLAAQIHVVAESEHELAVEMAWRALACLLSGETPYALAWLAWLGRSAIDVSDLPNGHLDELAPQLLELRLTEIGLAPGMEPGDRDELSLPIREADPHAGLTFGEAFRFSEDVLVMALTRPARAGAPSAASALRTWALEDAHAGTRQAAYLDMSLGSLHPALGSALLRRALVSHGLWTLRSPMDDAQWALVRDEVRRQGEGDLAASPSADHHALSLLVRAWLWGVAAGRSVEANDMGAFQSVLARSTKARRDFDDVLRLLRTADMRLPADVVRALGEVFASKDDVGNLVTLLAISLASTEESHLLLGWLENALLDHDETTVNDRRVLARLCGLATPERVNRGPSSTVARSLAACVALVHVKWETAATSAVPSLSEVVDQAPAHWRNWLAEETDMLRSRLLLREISEVVDA